MKTARNLLAFGFIVFAGCGGDASDPQPKIDSDSGSQTSPDAGIAVDANVSDSGSGAADAGLGDAAHGGSDAADGDSGSADAGQVLELPFRGDLTLSNDFIARVSFPVEVTEQSILVIEVHGGAVDPGDVRVERCGPEAGSCIGTSLRTPQRDYIPYRTVSDLDPGSYSVEFSTTRLDDEDIDRDIDVGIDLLPFESVSSPPESFTEPQELDLPAAYEVDLTEGRPAWFTVDAQSPGYLSLWNTNDRVFVCEMEAWVANPAGCILGTREIEREIERVGPVYVLATSTYDTTRDFVVFYDEDPNATPCAAGEHPAGDGTCSPEGACAAGYHDGGWGDCVPDGTCSPNFELRTDGRCQGWVAAGGLDVWDGVNDRALPMRDGKIAVTGYQRDSNGDSIYAPQVWDPATETWSTADPTASPVGTRRFCALSDGRLLSMRFGGFISTAPVDSERLFDPATGAWSVPMNTPGISWTRPSCVLLDDGRTLVFESGDAHLFDPVTESWTSAGLGPNGSDHKGVEASIGHVYSAANDAAQATSRHLWHWDSTDDSWTQTSDWTFADELDNDLSIVAFDGDPVLFLRDGRIARFDTATEQWQELSPIIEPNGQSLWLYRATSRGGEVLFTFGSGQRNVGVYDLATEQWEQLPTADLSGVPMISQGDYFLVGKYPQRFAVGE